MAITYTRNPDGFELMVEEESGHVTVETATIVDSSSDIGTFDPMDNIELYGIRVTGVSGELLQTSCLPIDGSEGYALTNYWNLDVIGEYTAVQFVGYPAFECGNSSLVRYGEYLEYNSEAPIFEVIPYSPEPEPPVGIEMYYFIPFWIFLMLYCMFEIIKMINRK